MRKKGISMLIVCFYLFPFVYFSMHQDFANGSMLGYLMMILVTSLLAFLSKMVRHPVLFIIGNIISGAVSLFFINKMAGNERWDGYFKPLSPNQLFILVSFINFIPQLLAMKLAGRYNN